MLNTNFCKTHYRQKQENTQCCCSGIYVKVLFFVSQCPREKFVEAYVNYMFNCSIHEWYTAFSTGFLKVCGGKVLELFQPTELRAMIVGNSNYNWEELEEVKLPLSLFLSF